MSNKYDLRYALSLLKEADNELIETERPVDTRAEIAGIYRKIGARGTVKRPTKLGPAMLFDNIESYPDARIAIGLLGTRERVGRILGTEPSSLPQVFLDALEHPVDPVVVDSGHVPCREIIYSAEEEDFDLRKILPLPLTTERDAGPYITMGLCHAHDPETGNANLAVHRLCIQGRDEMTMGFGGVRHIGQFFQKAKRQGKTLPVSINIGVDPAIYISSCFQPPATPYGFDELAVAGAVRGEAVELVKCLSIDEYAIANAEYVIEGELLPDQTAEEDQHTHTGWSLPEFSGYNGAARRFSILKVKRITCRKNPIMQICIGSSEEHVNMAGITLEAGILRMVNQALPGKVSQVYCPPAGGGKLMAILQCLKENEMDEGKQKQAALLAFGACMELKNIILVDADVDIYDMNDVMWAFNTRFKPEMDLSTISNIRCHKADPTQKKFYDPTLRTEGLGTKAIYDCTVPFHLKEEMKRVEFMEVDVSEFSDKK
ncbi:MAG: UbiD family decarboxylase [Tannerellaceae bacterium]|nr:UbiD family decarboxylase [Tannerellaceae bacterium]